MTRGPNLIIRERLEADEQGVKEVRALAFARLREVYRPTRAAVEAGVRAEDLGELVAVEDGRVVGNVRYRERAGRLHIVGVAVRPECQRRGIGRAMVERVAAIARDRGVRELSLFTVEQTGNVPIFEQMGFVVVSRQTAEEAESVRGEALTDALMVRGIRNNATI